MKAYELLYFVAPSADETSLSNVEKRIEAIITEADGRIDDVDDWGRRKLAYEIDGLTDANYTLIDFHADPDSIVELNRVLRISDNVIRHMIVARPDKD